MTVNVITEAMYAQFDGYGNEYFLLDSLVDKKNDNFSSLEEKNIVVKHRESLRIRTCGCKTFCQWTDGSTSWKK